MAEQAIDSLSQAAIRLIKLTELHLDARNPRLLDLHAQAQSQPTEVELAQKIVDEHDPRAIGRSIVEFGFFQTDPMIVFARNEGGYTVVEGNRRLLAVKLVTDDGLRGQLELANEWSDLAARAKENRPGEFDELPCQEVKDRRAAAPAIGYRHIVGIKKWGAYEKAAFVVELIRDPDHRDFAQVSKLTGESVAKVKTYFRDFLILDQAEKAGVDTNGAREEFGKFTRAMNEPKLREYIQAAESQEIEETAETAYVDDEAMRHVIGLMFGEADGTPPAFTDSRKVHDFAISLAAPESREILLNTRDLPAAFQASGGPLERLLKNLGDGLGAIQKAAQDYSTYKDEPDVAATLDAIKEALRQLEEGFDLPALLGPGQAAVEAGDDEFDEGWDDEDDSDIAESESDEGGDE